MVILQDNQSAMYVEQNGILSSSKRTKHMDVRYYFVKSKIEAGEVTIEWCPTDKLVGDFSGGMQMKVAKTAEASLQNLIFTVFGLSKTL